MNLAEALRERSALVGEIATLQSRIQSAVQYVEFQEQYTNEGFINMNRRLDDCRKTLLALKNAINTANQQIVDGETVQQLIILRGETKAELDFWSSMRSQATVHNNYYASPYGGSTPPPRTLVRVTLQEADSKIDSLVRQLKTIDMKISERNGRIQIVP